MGHPQCLQQSPSLPLCVQQLRLVKEQQCRVADDDKLVDRWVGHTPHPHVPLSIMCVSALTHCLHPCSVTGLPGAPFVLPDGTEIETGEQATDLDERAATVGRPVYVLCCQIPSSIGCPRGSCDLSSFQRYALRTQHRSSRAHTRRDCLPVCLSVCSRRRSTAFPASRGCSSVSHLQAH